MPASNSLADRINAEFAAVEKQTSELKSHLVQEYHGRQQRLEKLDAKLESLKGVWKPRLDALAQRFTDKVQVKPAVTSGNRSATFKFQSPLAHIDLRFSVVTDEDVKNAIFQYDLEILPILMKFDGHREIRFPLDSIDEQALAGWFDDQIVSFVKTYLALHQNNYYLKDHLVEDPIAKVRFPKFAAGAKLDVKGKTVYFIDEETRRQFEQQQSASTK